MAAIRTSYSASWKLTTFCHLRAAERIIQIICKKFDGSPYQDLGNKIIALEINPEQRLFCFIYLNCKRLGRAALVAILPWGQSIKSRR